MDDILRFLVPWLTPVIALALLALFFFFYEPLWKATTTEPFTNILRRNKGKFWVIIPFGIAPAIWLMFLARPWWSWTVVLTCFVWLFIGHIFWAGIRWGRIHNPTAWRAVHELTLIAESMPEGVERGAIESASKDMAACLEEMGIPFRSPVRTGERLGLCERENQAPL